MKKKKRRELRNAFEKVRARMHEMLFEEMKKITGKDYSNDSGKHHSS